MLRDIAVVSLKPTETLILGAKLYGNIPAEF